ncbi:hypothetical protein [Evansella tamaricis]|uniref:Uncharacterized protein n=1 Tax=Evansella tamaricis TaxID=2069301 RepID=A0ABS6JBI8_9BACI|nr:hypothetical protein [Evansella tamaricis]MBU9711036.1 hypothetical protein [Evansella tamaricis]
MRKPRLVSFNLEDEQEKKLFEFTYTFNFSKQVKRWLYAEMNKKDGVQIVENAPQVDNNDLEDVSSFLE